MTSHNVDIDQETLLCTICGGRTVLIGSSDRLGPLYGHDPRDTREPIDPPKQRDLTACEILVIGFTNWLERLADKLSRWGD